MKIITMAKISTTAKPQPCSNHNGVAAPLMGRTVPVTSLAHDNARKPDRIGAHGARFIRNRHTFAAAGDEVMSL